jgi:alpha-beta hydrolase superfamily lysophospholipase
VARRTRTIKPVLPEEIGSEDGLAYSLWLPPEGKAVAGGVVILHGAGSGKENHHDYARAAVAAGLAAIAFDQRGHGDSPGPMDGRAVQDVASMAALLRSGIAQCTGGPGPIALRGSSMGGYLALVAATEAGAVAVVAICPASGEGLARALAAGRLAFEADVPALERLLIEHDLNASLSGLDIPVLLLHAEGDEQVPVGHSRELAKGMAHPRSRLIVVPGGHHRSIQHDPEMTGISVRFLERALRSD